jgi:thiol-disulfide isomerase/thioredoxin
MKQIRPFFILLIGALSIYLLVACSNNQPGEPLKNANKNKKSAPAPDFNLPNLTDQTVKLSQYRGKIVVLNFWATWCGPCRMEIPDFIDAQKIYRDKGVEFIGIAIDEEGKEIVKPFADKLGMNYLVLIGDEKTVNNYGGISAIPTTFFIDRDGQIQGQAQGALRRADLTKVLDQLLAGQS